MLLGENAANEKTGGGKKYRNHPSYVCARTIVCMFVLFIRVALVTLQQTHW